MLKNKKLKKMYIDYNLTRREGEVRKVLRKSVETKQEEIGARKHGYDTERKSRKKNYNKKKIKKTDKYVKTEPIKKRKKK